MNACRYVCMYMHLHYHLKKPLKYFQKMTWVNTGYCTQASRQDLLFVCEPGSESCFITLLPYNNDLGIISGFLYPVPFPILRNLKILSKNTGFHSLKTFFQGTCSGNFDIFTFQTVDQGILHVHNKALCLGP